MVRNRHGTTDWFKIGKGVKQGIYCHSACLIICRVHHAKYGLVESQAGTKIAERNINLRYTDDTTPVSKSEEELKNLLMRVKEESERTGLKLNIKELRSWYLVPSIHGKYKGEK